MLLFMGKKTITIFTPTFNRAHLLPRLYQSLCSQTSSDFLWLVIDDGSSDGTDELVKEWQEENKIAIEYHFKENGGMHTGHNLAYQVIDTELNVCIDSDDYMPKDAIEKMISSWSAIEDKSKIAGMIGLDADSNGEIIGTEIPEILKKGGLTDLYKKYDVKGDKKVVLKTSILKGYSLYPEYTGEKLVPLGILYLMIGQDYDFIYNNDIYCIVEYQEDGSSNSIIKQYFQSPRGFAYARTIQKRFSYSFKDDCKNAVHIGVSSLVSKDFSLLKLKPKMLLNYLMFPIAIIAYLSLKRKIQ